jgi:hypothetical protein
MRPIRTSLTAALLATATAAALLAGSPAATAAPTAATATAGDRHTSRLTNLAHLDFLGAQVAPPAQVGHTTYQLDRRPQVGVLWTYAEHQSDGSFRRVGGGTYDAATNTYGQGAYNADDISRAAVVYLRDWRQTGSRSSRAHAEQLLRGLTYLQTATGPNAGNVVLWMQPDGTLRPSAEPKELPDPSDSDASYWLARTTWALGEGYAAFRSADPGFASFLRQRMDLAVAAIDRQVLVRDGTYLQIDGRRTPAWLIANGADASAEAVLGLTAYVRAGGSAPARHALARLSAGIAALSGGTARSWPFGAVLPWALSRSDWHAWSSQMPAALAGAATVLGDRRLARTAALDSFTFDPWMLTSGGADSGRLPSRVDGGQIAYGTDSRVQSLLATGGPAAEPLAGLTAAWFLGANASGRPTFDPTTGVTVDGVAPDGTVNLNSGAESTIHGLLTMLALDAHPAARRVAATAQVRQQVGTTVVQAEGATTTGAAQAVSPTSPWTGESQYGGTGYLLLGQGATATIDLGAHPDALLVPVLDLQPGSDAVTVFRVGGRLLGSVRSGAVGAQGDSPAPGALLPVTLPRTVPSSATTLTTSTAGDGARLDAVMVQPLISLLSLGSTGGRHGSVLLRSADTRTRWQTVAVPGHGRADVRSYDGLGHLLQHSTTSADHVRVPVVAGGFSLVLR